MSLLLTVTTVFAAGSVNTRQHVGLHFGISSISSLIAYEYGYTHTQSAWIGFGTSLLIGLAKEASDTNFDSHDIMANTVGGALGTIPVFYYKF